MAETAIRWDSLLVRHVARELHERLTGQRAHALHLDRERLAILLRCGNVTLGWELSAGRGDLHIMPATERLRGNVPLPRPAVVGAISAAPDERVLRFRFDPGAATEDRKSVV